MENIKEVSSVNKYLESMRKANKKYRDTHKDKFNENQKLYYHTHKHDEEYMGKQRKKAKKSYHKKKEEKKEEKLLKHFSYIYI